MPTSPSSLNAFRRAIRFIQLKSSDKKLSDKDIAEALDITPSYLSQILNAQKPLSLKIIQSLENTYHISLNNPMTYMDLSEMGIDPAAGIDVQQFIDTYLRLKDIIQSQSIQIQSLRQALQASIAENEKWLEFYNKYESIIVAERLRNSTKEKAPTK